MFSAAKDKKAEDIIVLDLKKIEESVTNYFLICEASSKNQVKAIGEHIIEKVKYEKKILPYGEEGKKLLQWYLIDYIDIVVHIFLPEYRQFYTLEEYWNDAKKYLTF